MSRERFQAARLTRPRMTPEQVLEQAKQSVRFARNLTSDVEFSPEDGYRSDVDYLCRVLEAVIAEGATTINVPDTVGYAVPELYGNFIRQLRERVPRAVLPLRDEPGRLSLRVLYAALENAERAALNAPIQGSAADIMKLAMLRVDRALGAGDLRSRVLLQVHDELVIEIASGEAEAVEALVREQMGAAVEMDVPLDVSVGLGRSWHDAAH